VVILSQALFVICMLGGLLVPSALFGQWWLFASFFIFGVIFGVLEIIAKIKSGKTVSQHFWEWSRTHKSKAWILLACMLIAWLALLVHLGDKWLF
jgi:hypothetical protein